MSIVSRRRIAAMAAVAVMGIVGPVTGAKASGDVLYGSNYDQAHVCTVLGQDSSGTKGVLCVDLLTDPFVLARGQVEIFCEKPGTTVQTERCADAYIQDVESSNAVDGVESSIHYWECGHTYGKCAIGRNYRLTDPFSVNEKSDCQTDVADNFWTVVGSAGIQLPGSGQWVYLGSSNANDGGSESTGHWYVCP